MDPLVTYLINVAIYSFFPFVIASLRTHIRVAAFYVYIGILLLWGGLAGAVYSFSLFDKVQISGGNLTYGAFMMSTVMLIIIERRTTTFLNLIRLVVGIDSFVFVGFNFLSWILKNDLAINQLQTPYAIFNVSLWVLVIGGVLILLEILFLLAIFIYLRNRITNVLLLSAIYTVAFIFILCFDGVLFPIFAIGLNADLIKIMFGNVLGKLTLALTFSVPLAVFFLVFRKSLVRFIETPLILEDIVNFRKEELIDRIYKYELRQQAQEKEMEKLIDIAGKDPLTSLANRRRFESAFEAEWSVWPFSR